MLVHKRTLGVLEYAPWDGTTRIFNGVRMPYLKKATLEGLGLDEEDWWEIPDGSTLALRISIYEPWFFPITDDNGMLVGIDPWPKWKIYGEQPPKDDKESDTTKVRKRRKRKQIKFC